MAEPTSKQLDGVRVLLDQLLASGGELGDVALTIAQQLGIELKRPPFDLELIVNGGNKPLRLKISGRTVIAHVTRWEQWHDHDVEPVYGTWDRIPHVLPGRQTVRLSLDLIGQFEEE